MDPTSGGAAPRPVAPHGALGRLVADRRRVVIAVTLAAAVVFALSFALGRAGRSEPSPASAPVVKPLSEPAPVAVVRTRELPALGERPEIPPLKRRPRPRASEQDSGAAAAGTPTASPTVPSSPSPVAPSSGTDTGGAAPSAGPAPSTGGGSGGGGGGSGGGDDGVLCSPC